MYEESCHLESIDLLQKISLTYDVFTCSCGQQACMRPLTSKLVAQEAPWTQLERSTTRVGAPHDIPAGLSLICSGSTDDDVAVDA